MRKIILAMLIASFSYGASCRWTAPYFRKYSNEHLGISFPYQLFMAQGWHESKCSLRAISSDGAGSKGVGQITWRWWKHTLKKEGIPNLRTIDRQCEAQVVIMKKLIEQARAKTGYSRLWIAFQAYNGGWLVAKEVRRAGNGNHSSARLQCRRKIIHFRNGTSRSACDINYNYSEDIYHSATKWYAYNETKQWRFW
jgi:hypothetical protein